MGYISLVFKEVFFRPIFNGLILTYDLLPPHDLGISIVVLTILFKVVTLPLTYKSMKAQKIMTALQPKIKEIQDRHKDNKEEQAKQLMKLYSDHKANPLTGCLPLLLQLPFLIALYRVFFGNLGHIDGALLYGFVQNPETFNTISLGLVDLSHKNYILAVVAGITQFLQAQFMPQPAASGNQKDMSQALTMQMKYFLPAIITFWSFSLPAALPLYWTVLNLFAIVQQVMTDKYLDKKGVLPGQSQKDASK